MAQPRNFIKDGNADGVIIPHIQLVILLFFAALGAYYETQEHVLRDLLSNDSVDGLITVFASLGGFTFAGLVLLASYGQSAKRGRIPFNIWKGIIWNFSTAAALSIMLALTLAVDGKGDTGFLAGAEWLLAGWAAAAVVMFLSALWVLRQLVEASLYSEATPEELAGPPPRLVESGHAAQVPPLKRERQTDQSRLGMDGKQGKGSA